MILLILSLLAGCGTKTQSTKHLQIQRPITHPFTVQNAKSIPIFAQAKINLQLDYHQHPLLALQKLSNFIVIHPQLQSSIKNTQNTSNNQSLSYRAFNKSLFKIVQEICALYSYRMRIRANSIEILPNTPYIHLHHVSLLDNNVKTLIKTGVNPADQKGINLGSIAQVETNTTQNIFQDIQNYLDFLVQSHSIDQDAGSDMPAQTTVQNIAPEPNKDENVQDLNTIDLEALVPKETPEPNHQNNNPTTYNPSYSINKQAGVIVLKAPQSMHLQLAKYLHNLERKSSTQVKIEAQIIQIDLKDEFNMGINWNNIPIPGKNDLQFNTQNTQFASFSIENAGVNGLIEAMQNYGTTQIISKPELTILHNELGLFKVVENKVYFKMKTYQVHGKNNEHPAVFRSCEPNVVPIGFSMSIQPSIDHSSGDVLLHIRPTITSITSEVNDPSVSLESADNQHSGNKIESKYPIVASKEFDTKLRLKSGQWAILGGHIDSIDATGGSGFPGVKSALGALFGNKTNKQHKKEIVCLLRAHPQNASVMSLNDRLLDVYRE